MTKVEEYYQKALALNRDKHYSVATSVWEDALGALYQEYAKKIGMEVEQYLRQPPGKIQTDFKNNNLAAGIALCSMHLGDMALAARMFQDSISSLTPDSAFVEPFYYLTFVQYISGYQKEAKQTWQYGLTRDPQLPAKHKNLFGQIDDITTPGTERAFGDFLKN
jgi:tetratricopeptide (TPR) repeat protein